MRLAASHQVRFSQVRAWVLSGTDSPDRAGSGCVVTELVTGFPGLATVEVRHRAHQDQRPPHAAGDQWPDHRHRHRRRPGLVGSYPLAPVLPPRPGHHGTDRYRASNHRPRQQRPRRNGAPRGVDVMTDKLIRVTTALAVLAVAVVAAIISYQHAYELIRAHGETGFTARLLPLTVDGLIWAASMVILDASRRHQRVPRLALWSLGTGIVATIGAN